LLLARVRRSDPTTLSSLLSLDVAAASPLWLGIGGSLAAGLATAVGALPVFGFNRISQRTQDGMLGFAAGVMLAATVFSLLLPAMEEVQKRGGGAGRAAATVAIGMAIGTVMLHLANRYMPHEHFLKGKEGGASSSSSASSPPRGSPGSKLARIWLFVIAITIHNFPEGLAVGVGFGGGDVANGKAIAVGIGLQNMPEGFAVALALLTLNYPRWQAFGVALLSGLVEPIGGAVGAVAVTLSEPLLPWALAIAGGAMLFVVSGEIIPETHGNGHETVASFALVGGFIVMMLLDTTLG
jgi:ZIP family zinc transporter